MEDLDLDGQMPILGSCRAGKSWKWNGWSVIGARGDPNGYDRCDRRLQGGQNRHRGRLVDAWARGIVVGGFG